MPKQEIVARMIAVWRGVDPDAPVTIVSPEGGQQDFDPAWQGYAAFADELIAAVQA